MEEDVAEALTITHLCQELHCLPRTGGLLDQDSFYVWMMEQVIAAEREKEARDNKNKPGKK